MRRRNECPGRVIFVGHVSLVFIVLCRDVHAGQLEYRARGFQFHARFLLLSPLSLVAPQCTGQETHSSNSIVYRLGRGAEAQHEGCLHVTKAPRPSHTDAFCGVFLTRYAPTPRPSVDPFPSTRVHILYLRPVGVVVLDFTLAHILEFGCTLMLDDAGGFQSREVVLTPLMPSLSRFMPIAPLCTLLLLLLLLQAGPVACALGCPRGAAGLGGKPPVHDGGHVQPAGNARTVVGKA